MKTALLGAFDTLYYHEYRLRLPSAFAARKELKLHAARDFIYAIIFGSLAWRSWDGLWAWVLVGLFVTELVITLWDFFGGGSLPQSSCGRAKHTCDHGNRVRCRLG